MPESRGYRGYITSRPFLGERVPQHVQNLVIRDYCARHGFQYLLSATEYAMVDCHMMLEGILSELPDLEGVVLYSIYLLPRRPQARQAVFQRVFAAGGTLHGAVEDLSIATAEDAGRVEDLWRLRQFFDDRR